MGAFNLSKAKHKSTSQSRCDLNFELLNGFVVLSEHNGRRIERNCGSLNAGGDSEILGWLFDAHCVLVNASCLHVGVPGDVDLIQLIGELRTLNIVAQGLCDEGILLEIKQGDTEHLSACAVNCLRGVYECE